MSRDENVAKATQGVPRLVFEKVSHIKLPARLNQLKVAFI